ncbi:DNA glycosylase [Ochromonadaceae sp. CCMP2298]|nr:DNA glycosylase [Ochromonadaceae sp. CCMP2298]|mmetsp:Transcript_10825/g.23981  ORF Transcript_10825/g.23981 Transcript_10825/m.23981 type:complete len:313 (+) Transcript_10825:15-953(+)
MRPLALVLILCSLLHLHGMKIPGTLGKVEKLTKMKVEAPKAPKVAKARVAVKSEVKSESCDVETSFKSVLQEAEGLVTRGGWEVGRGLQHLVDVEPRFKLLIGTHRIPKTYSGSSHNPLPTPASEHFHSLLKIIIYQQLSAKSAAPIFTRFLAACSLPTDAYIQPSHVQPKFLVTLVEGKRKVLYDGKITGLSESKAKYIQDLAAHFLNPDRLQGRDLSTLSDDELRTRLLGVKGLGQWSVDMFMLFDLHRSNVLPIGDLGVRRGIALLHNLPPKHFETKKSQEQLPPLCAKWAPYASLATCYMWKLGPSAD